MLTSPDKKTVSTIGVQFRGDILYVALSDGREIGVPLDKVPWLDWLRNASAEQRTTWSIEPGGFAIYWEYLDDGIEIHHLLSLESLS